MVALGDRQASHWKQVIELDRRYKHWKALSLAARKNSYRGREESRRNSNYCFFTGATAAAGIFVCQFVSGLVSISLFPGHFVGTHLISGLPPYRDHRPYILLIMHMVNLCRKTEGTAVATGSFWKVPTNRRKGPYLIRTGIGQAKQQEEKVIFSHRTTGRGLARF